MKHKVLFACPKSTKRTKRGRDSSFELLPHTRLSRRKRAWQASADGGQSKKLKSVSPHGFLYTTRANTSHERIEQIRVCVGSTPAYKGVAGVYEVCALTEPRRRARFGKAGTPAVSAWHGAKSSRQPVHLSLYSRLYPRSDGSLDMFAQEGVYCSRFGKAGKDREISKRERLR